MNTIKLQAKLKNCTSMLFDMDGIITNTMPDHCLAWTKSFKNFFNINVSPEEIYLREGEKSEKSVQEILNINQQQASPIVINNFLKYKSKLFNAQGEMPLYSGIEKCLQFLKQFKKLALVTGTPKIELDARFPKRLYDCFQVIITSCDVKNGKPNPEPYLKALRLLDEHPENALVVENAPYGIQSAINAKIEVVAIPTSLKKEHLQNATYLCNSHLDLFNIIFKEID